MKKEYTKIREQFKWAARKRSQRAKGKNVSKGAANDALSDNVRDPDTSASRNELNGGNNIVSHRKFTKVAFIERALFQPTQRSSGTTATPAIVRGPPSSHHESSMVHASAVAESLSEVSLKCKSSACFY